MSDPAHAPKGRAAIYARKSTPKQASIPQQILLCREAAAAKGLHVRYILQEELSAGSADRPKLQHLLRLVEERKIDVIVVWKLDRLVRSLRDLLNTHKWLEKHGATLVSVTEQFDTRSSFGRFSFRNIASAAELERDLIGERAVLGKLAQAQAGRWPTQEPPHGYRLGADRNLQVEPSEAATVRKIFKWYVGGAPLTEISRRLAKAGVFTRDGFSFSPIGIGKMVKNPIYLGRLRILGIEHERLGLRLVSKATEAKLEARRLMRARDGRSGERRGDAADALVADYFAFLAENENSDGCNNAPWEGPPMGAAWFDEAGTAVS